MKLGKKYASIVLGSLCMLLGLAKCVPCDDGEWGCVQEGDSVELSESPDALWGTPFSATPSDTAKPIKCTEPNPSSCAIKGSMSGQWNSTEVPCENCTFTNGKDVKAAGAPVLTSPTDPSIVTKLPAWDDESGLQALYPKMVGNTKNYYLPYSTNGNSSLPPDMTGSAHNEITRTLNDVRETMNTIASLTGIPVDISKPTVTTESWAKAFAPVEGRNKIELQKPLLGGYSSPAPLQELRSRGARTYCAMREAFVQQNGQVLDMGSGSSGDALFWTFGAVGSTLRLGKPLRELNNKTAGVYAVPLVMGSKLAPVKGPLMPAFGELTHNIMWYSGDAEVRTLEDPAWMSTCVGCPPSNIFKSSYRNIHHMDVMAGQTVRGKLTIPNVLLAQFGGLVKLFINGEMEVVTGELVSNYQGWGDSGALKNPPQTSTWPAARPSTLDLALSSSSPLASDAPMTLNTAGLLTPYAPGAATPGFRATVKGGMALRTQNDDDRRIVVRDHATERLGLVADASLYIGPLEVGIYGNSSVTATSEQYMIFSEHMSLVDATQALPTAMSRQAAQSNLVIAPQLKSSIDLNPLSLGAYFKLHIDLLFTDIDLSWDEIFLNLGTLNLAGFDRVADESARLRVGEFFESAFGTTSSQKPNTVSHLPGRGNFASFPTNLEQCFATTPNAPEAQAPEAGQATPGQVNAEICVVGFGQNRVTDGVLTSQVCQSDWAMKDYASNIMCGDYSDCARLEQAIYHLAQFLCSPTSKLQTVDGQQVRAHVLGSAAEITQLGAMIQEAAVAYAWNTPAEMQDMVKGHTENFLESFIDPMRACKKDGTLIQGNSYGQP